MADLIKHSLSYSREEGEKIYARAVWGIDKNPMRLGILNKYETMPLKQYIDNYEEFRYRGDLWKDISPVETAKLFMDGRQKISDLQEEINKLTQERDSLYKDNVRLSKKWWNRLPKFTWN